MTNTKSLVKLNKFKTQVDKLIYNTGLSFTSHLCEADPDHPGYAYVVNGVWIGLIYAVNGKFSGMVCDIATCNHMEKEGFDEAAVNEQAKWFHKRSIYTFVTTLIRK